MTTDEKEVPKPQPITVPPFCDRHQRDLVIECGYKPTDPWRALMIAAQVAMFQSAITVDTIQKRLDGDIRGIQELGCLACRLPQSFRQVIREGKKNLGAIKALGDGWVKKYNKASSQSS